MPEYDVHCTAINCYQQHVMVASEARTASIKPTRPTKQSTLSVDWAFVNQARTLHVRHLSTTGCALIDIVI